MITALKQGFHRIAWRRGDPGHLFLRAEWVLDYEETLAEIVKERSAWYVIPWHWGDQPDQAGPLEPLTLRFATARAAKRRAEQIVADQLERGDDRWR